MSNEKPNKMLTSTTHQCAGASQRSCSTAREYQRGSTASANQRAGGHDRKLRRKPEATVASSMTQPRNEQYLIN